MQAALPLHEKWQRSAGIWTPTLIRLLNGQTVTLVPHLVLDAQELQHLASYLITAPEIAYDSETSGLMPPLGARICGHAFASPTGASEISAWYIPVRHMGVHNEPIPQLFPDFTAQFIREILSAPGCVSFAHAKFDWHQLLADGVEFKRDFEDVSSLATIANENELSFSLKALGKKYVTADARLNEDEMDKWMRADARSLGMPYRKRRRGDDDEIGEPTYLEHYGYARTPIEMCGLYACWDVFLTLYLKLVTFRDIASQFPEVHAREKRVTRGLHRMEVAGLPVNTEKIHDTYRRTSQEVDYWLSELRALTCDEKFEATDSEVRRLLYEQLKMKPPKKTDSGAPAVDREARKLLAKQHPAYEKLFRALEGLSVARKLRSTYAVNILRYVSNEGKIHPTYNQLEEKDEGGVPKTGRLSSQNPNIQNVASTPAHLYTCPECSGTGKKPDGKPCKVKTDIISIRSYFFVPDDYVRLYVDFSQIELRVLAWFCQDATMLRAYANDEDLHQLIADELGIDRKIAKQVNFGNSYGMTEIGLAKRMPSYYDDPEGTRREAERVLKAYFARYPGILQFRHRFAEQMRRNGRMFVSPFGRPRRIDDIDAHERWRRERAERQMMSSIISGSAADIMKESMGRCMDILDRDSPESILRQSIHDELVFDLYRRKPWAGLIVKLVRAMEDWPMFAERGVPIKASASIAWPGQTWADKKEIKLLDDGTFKLAA